MTPSMTSSQNQSKAFLQSALDDFYRDAQTDAERRPAGWGETPDGSLPVGRGNYEVQQGDCMDSIAARFGFLWQTLWNLPENALLKTTRGDPNVLMPGDRLTVPGLRPKEVSAPTDKRHTYVRKGVPVKLVMCFYEDREPNAGEPYILQIEGAMHRGKLDSHGCLRVAIPPNARTGELTIGDDDPIPLRFGTLDPVATIQGVKGRLRNLGFNIVHIDGIMTAETIDALRHFQKEQGLSVTGTPDDLTRAELVKVHGS